MRAEQIRILQDLQTRLIRFVTNGTDRERAIVQKNL